MQVSIVFSIVHVQCRKESSRLLSHLLMSFLLHITVCCGSGGDTVVATRLINRTLRFLDPKDRKPMNQTSNLIRVVMSGDINLRANFIISTLIGNRAAYA